MTFYDLFIIYIAFGAPVSIYAFLRTHRPSIVSAVFFGIVDLIFWPITGLRFLLMRKARSRSSLNIKTRNSEIDRVRNIANAFLKDIAWHAREDPQIEDIAEVADRFAGLYVASIGTPVTSELDQTSFFVAAGHPNEEVAVACLSRRNHNRLERHLTHARQDIRNCLDRLKTSGSDVKGLDTVIDYLTELSEITKDASLERSLKGFTSTHAESMAEVLAKSDVKKWETTNTRQKQA